MKKINTYLLIIIFLLTFVGCKKENNYHYIINDNLEDGNNQTVKVIILSGQSNASGCSSVEYLREKVNTNDLALFEQGFKNIYINAFIDSGNNKTNGFVNPYLGMGNNINNFGPEIGISKVLNTQQEKYYIIKFTYSGTSLDNDWNINKNNLYPRLLAFIDQSLAYLEQKKYIPVVSSFLFMQGESDAVLDKTPYYQNLKDFVGSLRTKYGNFTFIDALISDSSCWTNYQVINQAKIKFSQESSNNIYIDTISNNLSYHEEPKSNPDIYHYDALAELKLGELFGEAILKN